MSMRSIEPQGLKYVVYCSMCHRGFKSITSWSLTPSSLSEQDLDPEVRWSPQQALQHPFLTGARFTGPFQPPPRVHVRARSAAAPRSADGSAAMSPYNSALYNSPVATMLATSPEFHAQAHAAAMAAVQACALPDVAKLSCAEYVLSILAHGHLVAIMWHQAKTEPKQLAR